MKILKIYIFVNYLFQYVNIENIYDIWIYTDYMNVNFEAQHKTGSKT